MHEPAHATVTAAVLVIGDEILSGRTKDKNIGFIAEYLTALGIDLKEVRVVPDEEDEIIVALNALRQRYTYVFTTGGIGPTHDDITADSVAKAFGVPIDVDPRVVEIFRARAPAMELNEARLRMARIPQGAVLVENKISAAPGFWLGNVIVMAGVPSIMQVDARRGLRQAQDRRPRCCSESVRANAREGDIGTPLGEIAKANPEVIIGSYPFFDGSGPNTNIVVRSRDAKKLAAAKSAVEEMLARVDARVRSRVSSRHVPAAAAAEKRRKNIFRCRGTSFIAMRARWRGGSRPPGRSRRS